MKSSFTTSGIEKTLEFFKNAKRSVVEAADETMEDFARRIFERSQYYVPVDTGSLKQSGTYFKNDDGAWVVGYGGDIGAVYDRTGSSRNPYYAVYVHEIEGYTHAPPTQWRYLAQAVDDIMPEAQREIYKTFGVRFQSKFYGVSRAGEQYAPLSQFGYGPAESSKFDAASAERGFLGEGE